MIFTVVKSTVAFTLHKVRPFQRAEESVISTKKCTLNFDSKEKGKSIIIIHGPSGGPQEICVFAFEKCSFP